MTLHNQFAVIELSQPFRCSSRVLSQAFYEHAPHTNDTHQRICSERKFPPCDFLKPFTEHVTIREGAHVKKETFVIMEHYKSNSDGHGFVQITIIPFFIPDLLTSSNGFFYYLAPVIAIGTANM